jgi:hypothetical protein
MALIPEPIKPGEVIRADWLNGVLMAAGRIASVKGQGYADNQTVVIGTPRRAPSQTTWIGKPSEDIVEGVLTSTARTINVWDGPANSSDAATGETVEADFATGAFTTSQYVLVTEIGDYKYVSCFPSGI